MLKSWDSKSSTVSLPAGFHDAPAWPKNETDLPNFEFRIEQWRSHDDLSSHQAAWQRLAEVAAEVNPFYEFTAIAAAFNHFQDTGNVSIIAVWSPPRVNPQGRPVLCGVFPVKISRAHNGVPARTVELWRHDQCFLTTPLVRHDSIAETWLAFRSFASKELRAQLIHLPTQSADSSVHQALIDQLDLNETPYLIKRNYYRALLQHELSADDYLKNQIAKKTRNELARLRRKLTDTGLSVEWRYYNDNSDLPGWLARFLALEKASWKGEQQTALDCNPQTRQFFVDWMTAQAENGRLQRLELVVDGTTIASKVNIVSGRRAFCFKIACSSDWHHYSPGQLLEIENINKFHESDKVLEMDSCADPHHPMIDRLWSGRRPIQSLLLSTERIGSQAALASYPLVRWAAQKIRRLRKPR